MKYGYIRWSNLNEKLSLSASDYLSSDKYMVCAKCKRNTPVKEALNEQVCSKECRKKLKNR